MAHLESGSKTGKFGVYLKDADGDTENSWHDTKSERDKVYKNMKKDPHIVHVKKITR